MARPREFDFDLAVSNAHEQFRRHGYNGTSIDDLLTATGIGKASFYAAFKSKHDLYLRALKHRSGMVLSFFLSRLEQRDVRKAIREVLEGVADSAIDDPTHAGCLLTNASTEVCPSDEGARELVDETYQVIEDAIFRALCRARDAGDLGKLSNPRAIASFFVTTMQGVRMRGAVHRDRQALSQTIDLALSLLDAAS